MILKGNQRAGGRQMALHLLNSGQNEHVTVHEVSGFMADDVLGALNEAYALSKGTQCKQFMYALSLNPPQDEKVPVATFENALDRIEKKLGLEGQPRVIVFHEKEGRRHCHTVWSRIDEERMKAIPLPHTKLKLQDIAKSLYIEHGWKMPEGFKDRSKKNPLNYTRAEWQQALRIGRKPDAIKREIQECWALSDNRAAFEHALQEIGYHMAKGQRGFVAVDIHGEIYSLPRQLGIKKKEVEARLGSYKNLSTVDEVKATIKGRLSKLFKRFSDELNLQHKQEKKPLEQKRLDMVKQQRDQREKLKAQQKERWQKEELNRAARIRPGFKGLWDKLTGSYWKSRKKNEREAWYAYKRDHKEREELFKKQMEARQTLQIQIKAMRDKQEEERKNLFRDISHAENINTPEKFKSQETERQSYPDEKYEIISDNARDLEPDEQEPAKGHKDKGFER